MNIFLSWSGAESQQLALIFKSWISEVLQHVQPWVSTVDIGKGERWNSSISAQLDEVNFGLVFCSPSNLHADWLLFEAGALSKRVESSRVCTVLWKVPKSELGTVLGQFQATEINQADVENLFLDINTASEKPLDENLAKKAFARTWYEYSQKIENISSASTDKHELKADRQLLEEILTEVRAIRRSDSNAKSTITKRVLVTPGTTEWVEGASGTITKIDENTGKAMTLVEVPPEYVEVTEVIDGVKEN